MRSPRVPHLASPSPTAAGLPLAPLESCDFQDGEFKLRPLVSVRARPIFVVQSLAASTAQPTADRLVRLLFLLCALRDGGASSVTAVIPYLAYARKERRTNRGIRSTPATWRCMCIATPA